MPLNQAKPAGRGPIESANRIIPVVIYEELEELGLSGQDVEDLHVMLNHAVAIILRAREKINAD